jgi:myo-inositol-1(or 4)-monophosphatase
MDLNQVAALVGRAADEELSSRFTRVNSWKKTDGSLITEADMAMQERLVQELGALSPPWPVLGEEMLPERQQGILRGREPFWCLDPLDGTTNFATGLPYHAVSLALIRDGRVQAGIVYDPQRRECFLAERGGGARLNGTPLRVTPAPQTLADCVALVDLKRMEPRLARRLVEAPPYRSQRSFGAVALDWCWLAAGRCHLYLHSRQNLWDYAAGLLVLSEAGGVGCVAQRPGAECEQRLELGGRVGLGAVSRGLFSAWRGFIRETLAA